MFCVLFILLTVISNVFLLNYIVFFFMVVVFGLLTQNSYSVMRKVWNLPSQCHVPIVLSVSGVSSLYRIIYNKFMKFYKSGLESKSTFVSQIFNESSFFAYTFIGYNLRLGHTHLKK